MRSTIATFETCPWTSISAAAIVIGRVKPAGALSWSFMGFSVSCWRTGRRLCDCELSLPLRGARDLAQQQTADGGAERRDEAPIAAKAQARTESERLHARL